jgi:hypothetical protein
MMNERIKELSEQATVIRGRMRVIDEEKLAELLIQKCVAISDDYVKDCTCEEHVNCKHPRSAIGRKIREYFGVEG